MSADSRILDVLARLVSFDTSSAHAQPTVELGDFVVDRLRHDRIRCHRLDCGGGRENLWFETGPEVDAAGRGLLLCGHTDVVPADEPEWTADPFDLRVMETDAGPRAVGRGVCDMKGFDAIAIDLIREVAERGTAEEPVCLLLTCDEEIGTVGAGRFVEQWGERPIPRRTIVGEPTSLRPVSGHKGHLSISIEIGGRGCHTGFPGRGSNAVERALPVLDALRGLREDMTKERTASSGLFPETPYPVLTVAMVRAGTAINVMPDRCSLRIGARLLPGEDADLFLPRLVEAIEAQGVSTELRPGLENPLPGTEEPLHEEACIVVPTNSTPSYAIAEDDPFLAEVRSIAGFHEPLGANFGTDAGRLVPLGCRSVIFGPGDISEAHRPDEWISVAELLRARTLLKQMIR